MIQKQELYFPKSKKYIWGELVVETPEYWCDTTKELRTPNPPYTLTKCADGVGALQFSPAFYKSGKIPNVTLASLSQLLSDFAVQKKLGIPFEKVQLKNGLLVSAASYHQGADFIRVWYVSDGLSFVLATYICDWEMRFEEASECEKIVRNIKFV